jgi:hypothetical protein
MENHELRRCEYLANRWKDIGPRWQKETRNAHHGTNYDELAHSQISNYTKRRLLQYTRCAQLCCPNNTTIKGGPVTQGKGREPRPSFRRSDNLGKTSGSFLSQLAVERFHASAYMRNV